MTRNYVDLSVVVPTYNQADLLRECLRSLAEQTLDPPTYEIVVVDDGSSDETGGVLEEFQTRVKSIRLPTNRGRSAARNAGTAAARGQLIVFVDSDVVVRRDFLQAHLQVHRREGSGILSRGPVVLVRTVAEVADARIPWIGASPAYLDTANAALEKALILLAGGFDETFPGYGWEDFELGMRLRKLGVRRVFSRQTAAFHVQPPPRWEAIDELLEKEEARARSAVHFYRKFPTLETRLLIQATFLHGLVYWLLAGCGALSPQNIVGIVKSLRRSGLTALAYFALRSVLNRHYHRALYHELRHAAAMA